MKAWYFDKNWQEIKIWDKVKTKVCINQEIHWEYVDWVVKESDEVMSWIIIDEKFGYIDIEDLDYDLAKYFGLNTEEMRMWDWIKLWVEIIN